MSRRIITAREQVAMLSPWSREAFIKVARYPQEWRADAPYGRFSNSGRARNRPPSVRVDPDDRSAGIIDPSDIRYDRVGDSVSAYHPNGAHLGNYSWEEDYHTGGAHIGIAQVHPKYQGQGVAGGIIDHIRENYQPELVHSGHRGVGSLSYQGRAGALRDLGNTEEEHNDYFNTVPFNHGSTEPAGFGNFGPPTEEQRKAHLELMQQFEEDRQHPNWTGRTSDSPHDPDLYDYDGDRYEYGYDHAGDYVGLSSGGKDYEGYSEEGYDHRGYDREGFDIHGFDDENYDQEGFHESTGLNRDGETRHGYTPGDGTPPEGTVPMSQMADHWHQHGLPKTPEQEQMMDDATNTGTSPTMYAVRRPYERSNHTGEHHVGNGDTLYSSLERARQVAYHPDDPGKDMDIVSADWLDPDHLHTDASGKTPEDFHYAPVSGEWDAEDTASTPANIVHDPQRHQRILGDLGHGWSQGNLEYSSHPSMNYTDPNSGRSGLMYQQGNGIWRTNHQPEFGSQPRLGQYGNYRDAANTILEGTQPGPSMEHHALEINNNYRASGGGEVDWEPHPSGQGLTARTPHGDLNLVQDQNTGQWNWHAGPHGHQPGDDGGIRGRFPSSLNRTAEEGIRRITERPFHGGLLDELGEGWYPHPTSSGFYTKRLPSGNHAFVNKDDNDGTYRSGIQRDNGQGQPSGTPTFLRTSPDLAQAKAFIHHRENPVPAKALGQGWRGDNMGPRYFPSYVYEGHPSGAAATVAWGNGGPRLQDGEKPGWRPTVHHEGDLHPGPTHKTPQEAAAWASSFMDNIGK